MHNAKHHTHTKHRTHLHLPACIHNRSPIYLNLSNLPVVSHSSYHLQVIRREGTTLRGIHTPVAMVVGRPAPFSPTRSASSTSSPWRQETASSYWRYEEGGGGGGGPWGTDMLSKHQPAISTQMSPLQTQRSGVGAHLEPLAVQGGESPFLGYLSGFQTLGPGGLGSFSD